MTASQYPISNGKARENGVSAHEIPSLNPDLAPRVTNTSIVYLVFASALFERKAFA
jgi:hypothetical protein